MTVKELKKILEEYPDEYIVYTVGGYGDYVTEATKVGKYLPVNNPEDKQGIILEEF